MTKILVADDDPLARQLTGRVLTRAGYQVFTAEDGLQALEYLTRKDGPRLALLDWTMPGLDGPGVCRKMRALAEQPYTYLILLTSRESKEDTISGFEAGADDYITKPCDAEELKARLRAGQRILQLQDKLYHDARHDPLTQLPNRAWFLKKLNDCFARTRERHDFLYAVLFLDLDRFKCVNDTLGHSAGDELIIAVAERLTGCTRQDDAVARAVDFNGPARGSDDFLARMGGDEFTILLEDIGTPADAAFVAERIQRSMAAPFTIAGQQLEISASIGIAVSGPEVKKAEDILRFADMAMYQSKACGGHQSRQFAEPVTPAV
ncbi:MAG TPA: diguanylate cyclase [Bryobacteraceae bacterium]|nr:diguanylate cyclase [Bryobacteraceae bacterium]